MAVQMKIILQYCRMFRSMATLSQKLAGITLPIHKYGTHLNSQGQVVDLELAMKNYRYAGEALCALWERDPIFGRPVTTQYIDQKSAPFGGIMFPGCDKEHTN